MERYSLEINYFDTPSLVTIEEYFKKSSHDGVIGIPSHGNVLVLEKHPGRNYYLNIFFNLTRLDPSVDPDIVVYDGLEQPDHALRAVLHFLKTGKPDPEFDWHRLDDGSLFVEPEILLSQQTIDVLLLEELSLQIPTLSRIRRELKDRIPLDDLEDIWLHEVKSLAELVLQHLQLQGQLFDIQALSERVLHEMGEPAVQYNPSLPHANGHEFEIFVADKLKIDGWTTRLTKKSGDQGIDVFAYDDTYSVAIQCKRYASSVGNGAVQEVHAGADFLGATHAVVVTNSSFTASAEELSRVLGVVLLHEDSLSNLRSHLIFVSPRQSNKRSRTIFPETES